jgi:hypothetical protein
VGPAGGGRPADRGAAAVEVDGRGHASFTPAVPSPRNCTGWLGRST